MISKSKNIPRLLWKFFGKYLAFMLNAICIPFEREKIRLKWLITVCFKNLGEIRFINELDFGKIFYEMGVSRSHFH